MGRLHEILAVEKGTTAAANKLLQDTEHKFGNENFFKGFSKSLTMIEGTPENQKLEEANRSDRAVPTTVYETLEYALAAWSKAEDVIFQKNKTNQIAISNIEFRGDVIAQDIPVDELMGLESRLEGIRKVFDRMPTLDAAKSWEIDTGKGKYIWKAVNPEITTKTEKILVPVEMSKATEHHPAQVQAVTKDQVVGNYVTLNWSGATTSAQKAEALATIDELISEVKKARMRANSVETVNDKIGNVIVDLLLAPLK